MVFLYLFILLIVANNNFSMSTYQKDFQQESKNLIQFLGVLSGWSYRTDAERANIILSSLSKEKYFPYQDIIINGELLWKGVGPECFYRYEAIHNALIKKYNRTITVLDIGANNGYFSLKLAENLGAQCIMVDVTDRLKNICEFNTNLRDKLIYLKKTFSAHDLDKMSKKINFDVIIALNVLHHIPAWKDFLDKMFLMADTVIIETPPKNDPRVTDKPIILEIEKELKRRNGNIIAQTLRTEPGFFNSLKKMEYGQSYSVPFYDDVKSSMYLFDNAPAKVSPAFIKFSTLSKFGLVYPK